MLKKNVIVYMATFLFFLTTGSVFAVENPVTMLENITKNVMVKLKNNSQTLKYEPEDVYPIIDTLILPHIDFSEMARWVVGRNAWHSADNTTRETFIAEFKRFVVKNYTHFLVKFRNEKVRFLPMRKEIKNEREIQVSSQIEKESGDPIRMDYRLILQNDVWKVFDIIVEGVSILEGYEAQFANVVKEGGVAAVIDEIRRQR